MSAWMMGYKIKWHKPFQMNHQTLWTSLIANFQKQTQPIQGPRRRGMLIALHFKALKKGGSSSFFIMFLDA